MQIYSKLFLNFTDCLCKLSYKIVKSNLELRDYFWDTLMLFFHACGESLLDVVDYKANINFSKKKDLREYCVNSS